MIQLRDTVERTLAGLPKLEGAFSPAVRLAPTADGLTLGDIPAPALHRLLADATASEEAPDKKLDAAYLIGTFAFCLAEPLVGLALRGHWLCGADPAGVALTPRFEKWTEDGETGVEQVFDICLDPSLLAFDRHADATRFAQTVQDLITPLCVAINATTGLSRPALFMLVSDSFAYAFLAHGRQLEQQDHAMALALASFGQRGTRLFTKKLRFEHISLPEAPEIGEWIRVRGGCCRAYTRPGKPDYCTTCVLRDDQSRTERYRTYLRRIWRTQDKPQPKDICK